MKFIGGKKQFEKALLSALRGSIYMNVGGGGKVGFVDKVNINMDNNTFSATEINWGSHVRPNSVDFIFLNQNGKRVLQLRHCWLQSYSNCFQVGSLETIQNAEFSFLEMLIG